MILLCGIPSETPLRLVTGRLDDMAAPCVMLNQRQFGDCAIEFEISRGELTGALQMDGAIYPLEEFRAIYTRMMDDRFLPELEDEPPDSPMRARCRGFHDTLMRWMEITPAHVINRCAPMATNGS